MNITKHQFEQLLINSGCAAAGLLGHFPLPHVVEKMAVWFFMRPDAIALEIVKKACREYLAELDDKGYVTFQNTQTHMPDVWPKDMP